MMDVPGYEPGRNSVSSVTSSAMTRAPSSDSKFDGQHMLFDSEAGTPVRRPRGLLDRMLGRTQSGGHRATASTSVLIPPASSMLSNDPNVAASTHADSPYTSPASRTRPNLVLQSLSRTSSTSNSPSTITPTTTSPGHHGPLLTLNTLSSSERTERVKRNRKLVQLLGNEISGADAFFSDDPHAPPLSTFIGGANYISPLSESFGYKQYRRHSLPISPTSRQPILSPRVLRRNFLNRNGDEFLPSSDESGDDDWENTADAPRQTPNPVLQTPRSAPPPVTMSPKSTESFAPHSPDPPLSAAKTSPNQHTLVHASSIASITTASSNPEHDEDHMRFQSPEEAERARKRATLAKLHRFLGSRVPPEAVLPLLAPEVPGGSGDVMKRAGTLHGHSAAAATSPLARDNELEIPSKEPVSPGKLKGKRKITAASSLLHPPSTHIPIAYMSDGDLDSKWSTLTGAQRLHLIRKQKKIAKMLGQCPPGMMKHQSDFLIKGDLDGSQQLGFLPIEPKHSKQYMQHRYSINSLTYLVKTNDQEQLQDLLDYIKTYDEGSSVNQRQRQGSSASSRHRDSPSGSLDGSLQPPSPTDSFASLAPLSARGETVEAHGFQQRRKRAAKLSSFFGVDYRELFTEVLDVIESEVQSDSMSGSLSPEETQELLVKLRKLKRA